MKLIHLGDLHIGKQLYGFSMLEDQEYILNQILEMTEREDADAVLLAGDLYDRSVPAGTAVLVMNRFLSALADRGVKVFAISGNHDSPERVHYLSRLLEKGDVYMQGVFTDPVRRITVEDPFGPVHFHLMPFARPAVMAAELGMESGQCGSCVEEAVKRMDVDTAERNVLLVHHFVVGGGPEAWLQEEEGEMSLGGTDAVPVDLFRKFDYVAMGHIHRPQKLGRETVRYAGSPLKYSFSEVNYAKSVPVIELGVKGDVKVRLEPLVPLRDMAVCSGTMEEIIAEAQAAGRRDDYMQIIIREEEELLEPMQTLRRYYPNLMQIVFERTGRTETAEKLTAGEMEKTGPEELFARFYREVSGRAFTEEKQQVIAEILQELREEEVQAQ